MAPFQPIRKYVNTRKKPLPQAEKALNALLSINQMKRWETSGHTCGHSKEKSVSEKSAESTFDRVLKSENYNNVNFTNFPHNQTESFGESSNLVCNSISSIGDKENNEEKIKSSRVKSTRLKYCHAEALRRSSRILKKTGFLVGTNSSDRSHGSTMQISENSRTGIENNINQSNDTSISNELTDEEKHSTLIEKFMASKRIAVVNLKRITHIEVKDNLPIKDHGSSSNISETGRKEIQYDTNQSNNIQINMKDGIDSKHDSFVKRALRNGEKLALMSSLSLGLNQSMYSDFEDNIRRISTPQNYYLRKNLRNFGNGPRNLKHLDLSESTSSPRAIEDPSSDSCASVSCLLHDSLHPISSPISSTPMQLNNKAINPSKTKNNKMSDSLLYSSRNELNHDKMNKFGKISKRKNTGKISRKTYVLLEHVKELEEIIRNESNSFSQVHFKGKNITNRKKNPSQRKTEINGNLIYVTPLTKTLRTSLSCSKSGEISIRSLLPRHTLQFDFPRPKTPELHKSLGSTIHECHKNCEHFTKSPVVILERCDFSKLKPRRKSRNTDFESSYSSLIEFRGFPGKNFPSERVKKNCYVILDQKILQSGENNCENRNSFLEISENKNDCEVITLEDSSILEEMEEIHPLPLRRDFVCMEQGKKFRRSLAVFKKKNLDQQMRISGRPSKIDRRTSIRIVPVSPQISQMTELASLALENYGYVSLRQSARRSSLESVENFLSNVQPVNDYLSACHNKNFADQLTARDIVLKRCGQTTPLNFEECYSASVLQHCQKIGEGVFGEVFMKRDKDGSTTVMKVIPIEGDQIVNLEKQKTFGEILSEIIISLELSNLKLTKRNNTDAFVQVKAVKCVEGRYPNKLLELWELYDENKQSENDSPAMFLSDQLYIVLELSNAGRDLESFQFTNAQQGLAVFEQVTCALAVAENELKFEHRDLHWGNVLITPSDKKSTTFVLDGKEIIVNNRGVKATIIDFTLSRVEYEGVIIFNDLAMDQDLFTAKGDYQFDIYRKMQENNGNRWQPFKPYSNVLWLHYLVKKAIDGFRYRNVKSKLHTSSLSKLKKYESQILDYNNTSDFIESNFGNP